MRLRNLAGDVGDGLDSAAEEVAAALLADHLFVDLAGRGGVGPGEVLVKEAFVVTEVEVGLARPSSVTKTSPCW